MTTVKELTKKIEKLGNTIWSLNCAINDLPIDAAENEYNNLAAAITAKNEEYYALQVEQHKLMCATSDEPERIPYPVKKEYRF